MTKITSDVFGIARGLPLNYVERPSADETLVESLTREKHVVIFGSSKQGKTSLRKHALNDEEYILVQCSNKWDIAEINSAILKRAGYEITQSNEKSASGKSKIFAGIKTVFGFGSAEGGAEHVEERGTKTTSTPLQLDPEDVNDIIQALDAINFNKFIVLEDFHYLPIETQKDFSIALKAYHESSKLCFIIIGVWLEEDRLTLYNGDLKNRLFTINADKWESGELLQVIEKGEKILNIKFSPAFKTELLSECFNNVYIVQEACYQCCQENKIYRTVDIEVEIGATQDAARIVKDVANKDRARFIQFLQNFSDGFQATQLQMHKWLLYAILKSNIQTLKSGIRYKDLSTIIKSKHPVGDALNPGNVTQALQSVAALQISKGTKPFILDYDQANLRLKVVDSGFIIWLEMQNTDELLEIVDLPI